MIAPVVVYTRAEIDAWQPSGNAWSALSSWTTLTRPFAQPGKQVTDLVAAREDGLYAKALAVKWATTGDLAYRQRCRAVLDAYRMVESWAYDTAESYRLNCSWAVTNMTQAASIIGYRNAAFVSGFLLGACWPILDWKKNANWLATCSSARLGIGALAPDPSFYARAVDYFHDMIQRCVYHPAHDAGKVQPLLSWSTGLPTIPFTVDHWGQEHGVPQVTSTLVAEYPAGTPLPPGCPAERRWDYEHPALANAGFAYSVRTIRAMGAQPEQHVLDRLAAAYELMATRFLHYLQTAKHDAPAPLAVGGVSRLQGYVLGRRTLGPLAGPNLLAICQHPAILGSPAKGYNAIGSELFADA